MIYGIEYGGPAAGIVHQDRLVLAGSIGVPDLVAASVIGDWNNFQLEREVPAPTQANPDATEMVATPADGFWFQQSTSRNNPFHAILQQEGLFLFGGAGEATVEAGPFTAADGGSQIRENSWFGAKRGVPPLIVSGLACFIQEGGADIRGIAWTEAQRKYEVVSLREVAGSVFRNAVDLAGRESTADLAPTIFVVDEGGRVGVVALRQSEPRISWSIWDLGYQRRSEDDLNADEPARAVAVATVRGETLFLVEREGEVRLERLGERSTDSAPMLELVREVGSDLAARPVGWEQLWVNEPDEEGNPQWARHDWPADATGLWRPGTIWTWRTSAPDVDPPRLRRADFADNAQIRIGRPRYARIETVPFARPSETGTRLEVLRSRIFNLVCIYQRPAPKEGVLVDNRPVRSMSYFGVGERNTDNAVSEVYGALFGWRQRSTILMDLERQCTMLAMTYRASG